MKGVIGVLLVVLGAEIAYLVLSGKLASLASLASPASPNTNTKATDPKQTTPVPGGINTGAPVGSPVINW